MRIDGHHQGDTLILAVGEPRIDAACAVAFKDAVRAHLAGHDGPVTLDLAPVTFLDSSGLGALVAVMKMLGPDRKLQLSRCGPAIRRVLDLTHMDRVFVLRDVTPGPLPTG